MFGCINALTDEENRIILKPADIGIVSDIQVQSTLKTSKMTNNEANVYKITRQLLQEKVFSPAKFRQWLKSKRNPEQEV